MTGELYQKGWTQITIAKETGFDRKTIRKYLDTDKSYQSVNPMGKRKKR